MFELTEVRSIQGFGQIILAGQDDLKKFLFGRFKIGEQSNFFERFGAQRVGLSLGPVRQVWEGFQRHEVTWSRPWALFTLVRWAEQVGIEGDLSDAVEPEFART